MGTNQSLARTGNRPKVPVVGDRDTLEGLLSRGRISESLKAVLPKHLTPDRVVKMALVAASRQPRLWECTQESILQAIMKSAELGLDCSGTLGRAYLVPYYNSKLSAYECQFIPGYQGLIELARRSGNIARIESRVVHENDFFEMEYGLEQKLVHRPNMTQAGAMLGAYAIAELTDGSRQLEFMTREEIESIRGRSKAKDSGPWVTDYEEMARKTVIRRLAKYLPLSTELEQAFAADDEQFLLDRSAANDMAAATRDNVSALKKRVEAAAKASAPSDEEPEPEPIDAEPIVDEPDTEEAETVDALSSQLTYEEAQELVEETIKTLDPAVVTRILAGRKVEAMDAKALIALHGELLNAAPF